VRIVFLGTPDFAAIPLRALAADGRYELVGVVTQPDRPAGRGQALREAPVKRAARELGLAVPVLQPETLKDPAVVAQVAALRPDVGVVAAYGEILRQDVLAIPPHGYVNLHPSLLPRHRGPMPVAGAILAGDTETGVTVMQLVAKMDAGPIIAQERVPLAPDARTGPLTIELFERGAALLAATLAPYCAGELVPQAQDESQATYTRRLTRADGQIDWTLPAEQIERMTRAYDPWPGAFTTFRGQPLKIIAARPEPGWRGTEPPGTLLDGPAGLRVATGAGALELLVVQPAGRRALAAADWRRGLRPDPAGERLGA
jgi:methionyl-tRNA formyltransferase